MFSRIRSGGRFLNVKTVRKYFWIKHDTFQTNYSKPLRQPYVDLAYGLNLKKICKNQSNGRSDGRTVGRAVGRVVGRSDGRSDGRTDGRTVLFSIEHSHASTVSGLTTEASRFPLDTPPFAEKKNSHDINHPLKAVS